MSLISLLSTITTDAAYKHVTLNPSTTLKQVELFESRIGLHLPGDLRLFYMVCNGLEINNGDLLRILPLEESLSQQHGKRFSIAEYMLFSDTWELNLDPSHRNNYWISNESLSKPLTRSLAEFIQRASKGVFGEGGLYDWHEEIKAPRARDIG